VLIAGRGRKPRVAESKNRVAIVLGQGDGDGACAGNIATAAIPGLPGFLRGSVSWRSCGYGMAQAPVVALGPSWDRVGPVAGELGGAGQLAGELGELGSCPEARQDGSV
jgi:hypothetical protein